MRPAEFYSAEIWLKEQRGESPLGAQAPSLCSNQREKSPFIFRDLPRRRAGRRSRTNCDRRKRCRFARRSARICNRAAMVRERRLARVNRVGPIYRRRSARSCAGHFSKRYFVYQRRRSRLRSFPHESKSWHRKNDPARPSVRFQSARPSSFLRPARRSLAHGIRNPLIAWPHLPLRCRRVSNRADRECIRGRRDRVCL